MTEQELFETALDLAPEEQPAYLDSACAGDARLRRRIQGLLRSHAHSSGFMDRSAVEQLAAETICDQVVTDLSFLSPATEPGVLGRLDHYDVLEVVGQGSMGVVLRARDVKLQRIVALKVLAASLASSATARRRFAREARSAAAIQDERVVAIHAVQDNLPLPYLVMEFVEGKNLEVRLRERGHLALRESLQIAAQVVKGLAAAHQQGLVHRDVKPANILLDENGERVKLTDFGLARGVDDVSLTQNGLIAGTPLYMAPEQAKGEPVDHRTDLFSLGCVLYEMVTGRRAFAAPNSVAVIRRVCEESPEPVREICPEAPAALCDLIDRLLAKTPAERPASAQDVLDALISVSRDLDNGASALSRPAKKVVAKKPKTFRPISKGVVLFASVLVAVGLGDAIGVTSFFSAIVRLVTSEGTLVIEVDDPGVSVTIDDSDVVISGAGVKELRVRTGAHQVVAKSDGKIVREDWITLKHGERQIVRIYKEPAPAKVRDWETSVAHLSADEQVRVVATRLKQRNPEFDGKVTPVIRDGVVTSLEFNTDLVHDLSPVRSLPNLEHLWCVGTIHARGRLTDLSPLKGLSLKSLIVTDNALSDLTPIAELPLRELWLARNALIEDLSPLKRLPLLVLDCSHTRIKDLSPLKGMKLETLWCDQDPISDLSPLQGLPLTDLSIAYSKATDLSPLKGMRLKRLSLIGCQVRDLSPLRGMPLEDLNFAAAPVKDFSPLKGMPLRLIEGDFQPERDAGFLRAFPTLQKINGKAAADFLNP